LYKWLVVVFVLALVVFVMLRFPYTRAIESLLQDMAQGHNVRITVGNVDINLLYATAYLKELRIEYEGVNVDIQRVRVRPRLMGLLSLKLEFTVNATDIKVGSAFIPVLYMSEGKGVLKRRGDGWEVREIRVVGKGIEAMGKVYLSGRHIRYELKLKPSGVLYKLLERFLPIGVNEGNWVEVKGRL